MWEKSVTVRWWKIPISGNFKHKQNGRKVTWKLQMDGNKVSETDITLRLEIFVEKQETWMKKLLLIGQLIYHLLLLKDINLKTLNWQWNWLVSPCCPQCLKHRQCAGGKLLNKYLTAFLCGFLTEEIEEPLVIGNAAWLQCSKNINVKELAIVGKSKEKVWTTSQLKEAWATAH